MATTTDPEAATTAPSDTENDAMPQPRLDKLPEELIDNIAHRLDWDDITSLRQVCTTLEARTFHDFATEHFSAKGFIFTSESLKTLVGIANDKRLNSYLHSVYIVTSMFSENALQCPHVGCHCSWSPTVRESEAYKFYLSDQTQLKKDAEDKKLLTEAFQKLPKLTGLFLADRPHHAECNEGASTYGITKIRRRTGRPPTHAPMIDRSNKDYSKWVTHVWKTMCVALSQSDRSTITRFGIYVDQAPDGLAVHPEFKFTSKTLHGMGKALRNVKTLKLAIQGGNTLIKKDGKLDLKANVELISKFARTMKAAPLEEIKLTYDQTKSSGLVHVAFLQSLDLSKVKKLSLDGACLSASSIVAALGTMQSVTDIRIEKSNLSKGNWVPVLQAMQKVPTLEHLHLMWLQEDGRKVYLLTQREVDREDEWLDDGEADYVDDDTDDDDLPDLEPAPGYEEKAEFDFNDPIVEAEKEVPEEDFRSPGCEDSPERGYHVCLDSADKIARYLPIFIKEYNLGESLDDEVGDLGGLPFPPGLIAGPNGGPGPAFGALMTSIFGGVPPPPPGYTGPGAHVHGGHGHGHGGHGAGGGHTHGPGPMPPMPPGFVVGNGPGYGFMTGSFPMPGPPPGGVAQQPLPTFPPTAGMNAGTSAPNASTTMNGGAGSADATNAGPASAGAANANTATPSPATAHTSTGAENDFHAYFDTDDEEEQGQWDVD
ncbi:hypothetical protein LTS10_010863 [Elasticomyces elasticus]|nr:hypothetical protein LTS10_010863 [Elasticomyces elasticus]